MLQKCHKFNSETMNQLDNRWFLLIYTTQKGTEPTEMTHKTLSKLFLKLYKISNNTSGTELSRVALQSPPQKQKQKT